MQHSEIRFRPPNVADGGAIWRLVKDDGVLDLNSAYLYLLLCRDFGATCVLAERGDALLGFVTGYCPPAAPDVVFVWQVGVSPNARGEGIASAMLDALLASEGCRGVSYLETTVSPSNAASRALFAALARRLDAALDETEGFGPEMFPEGGHAPKPRLRIGPFDRERAVGPTASP